MLIKKAKYAKLPALPSAAQKIMAINLDADNAFDELVAATCQCPVTSARMLAMVNSASMWNGHKVTSIKEAVTRLGLTNAYSTAYAVAALTIKSARTDSKLNVEKLWRHNLDVVTVMQEISKRLPAEARPPWPDIALTGLLHDIGLIVFDALSPEASDKFHGIMGGRDVDVTKLEMKFFGTTHDVLGAELLASWQIPEKIVVAVQNHHDSSLSSTEILSRVIAKAEDLLERSSTPSDDKSFAVLEESSWKKLGINKDQKDSLRDDLNEKGISLSF